MFLSTGKSSTILIRLSSKCSSNCLSCDLPYLSDNNFYDLSLLFLLLKKIDNIFPKNFEIGFLGYNLLSLDKIYEIIDYFNYRNFILQIGIQDIYYIEEFVDKISRYKNLFLGIQETINNIYDFKKILKSMIFLNNKKINIFFNVLIDFKKFEKVLSFLKKNYKYQFSEGLLRIFINNNFIDFEDCYSISDIKITGTKKCIGIQNFKIENNFIYIKDDIEIKFDGTIKFHLNQFCNKGIKSISNINKPKNEIINDFLILEEKLNNYIISQNRCLNCLKNPIKL